MNLSRQFILRPVATTLLMAAILLAGAVAYKQLPVSALPQVDYPAIQVLTFYPGASPDVMASSVTGLSPFLHWVLAIIAGGTMAGVVQGITIGARAGSTATSLGTTNWIVSTAEAIGSFALSILALLLPAVLLIVIGTILLLASRRRKKRTPIR